MITKFDAVQKLVGGRISTPDINNLDEYIFCDGQTPPTDKEIQAKLAELQAEYDSKQYQRDRAVAYPSIQDQLDMQYHDAIDGTTTWKDSIAKVKADNPKPT